MFETPAELLQEKLSWSPYPVFNVLKIASRGMVMAAVERPC